MGGKISKQRIQEIALHYYGNENNLELTAGTFGVDEETVKRYLRELKHKSTLSAQRQANVLVLDIETSLMEVYTWGLYKQSFTIKQIKREPFILSWSAKLLGAPKVMSDVVTPEEAIAGSSKRIMQSLWNQLDEANIVIGHNVVDFDLRWIKFEFLKHGIYLPSPYQTIDTYKICKREFRSVSGKLDYYAHVLGIGKKMPTEYEWWIDCGYGNKDRLKQMQEYCDHDVRLEEELYFKIRPYIHNHPNVGLFAQGINGLVCASCGKDDIELKGEYPTPLNLYDAYQCNYCHSWIRARKGLPLNHREHLTRSIAR